MKVKRDLRRHVVLLIISAGWSTDEKNRPLPRLQYPAAAAVVSLLSFSLSVCHASLVSFNCSLRLRVYQCTFAQFFKSAIAGKWNKDQVCIDDCCTLCRNKTLKRSFVHVGLRRRGAGPDAEPTQNAPSDILPRLSGGRADSIHTATPDKTKLLRCVVSGVAMWTTQLVLTCSDFTLSVGDSLELSRIQFTSPRQTPHWQDSFVWSGLAMWVGR